MKIENSYARPLPPEKYVKIIALVEKYDLLRFLPYWVGWLTFQYETDSEHPAGCRIDRAYLSMFIGFGPEFWESDEGSRVEHMIHEISHSFTNPVASTIRRMIEYDLEIDDSTKKIFNRQITESVEQATETLAIMLRTLCEEN